MGLALYLILPALCVAAIPPARGTGGRATRLVLGIALYELLLSTIGLALGTAGHLSPQAYATASAAVAIGLLPHAWRHVGARPPRPTLLRWVRTRRGLVVVGLAAVIALAFLLQLGTDAVYGTDHADAHIYHLPRIAAWSAQASFAPFATDVWQQLGIPVGADVVLGAKVFLGLEPRGVAFVTAMLTVAAVASVYVAGIGLGLGRWRSAIAALLFASLPAVGARVGAVNSDIAAAFPVLAAYVSLTRIRRPDVAFSGFLLLNALAIACKPTIAASALVVAVAAIWRERAKVRAGLGTAMACATLVGAGMALASYWPVHVAFGDFVGGPTGRSFAVHTGRGFVRSVLSNVVHWTFEPLGYLSTRVRAVVMPGVIESTYRALGIPEANQTLEMWLPIPHADTGRTGPLAPLVLFPLIGASVPRGARPVLAAWLVAFLLSTGPIYPQPWSGRFHVVLFAGLALLWAGSRLFVRGRSRWVLTGAVALNVLALLALVTRYAAHQVWGV